MDNTHVLYQDSSGQWQMRETKHSLVTVHPPKNGARLVVADQNGQPVIGQPTTEAELQGFLAFLGMKVAPEQIEWLGGDSSIW